jgi:hypothetical protein
MLIASKKRKGEEASKRGGEKKSKTARPFYNTIPCQETLKSKKGVPCTNMAYFAIPGGKYVCGQHSLQMKSVREKLIKDPEARTRRLAELDKHRMSVVIRAKRNHTPGCGPSFKCFQMTMMGEVPLEEGWMNVFPNNKHENREDGYGCCSLSPMRLGPVLHRQPDIPPAKNIENYHQFNKVWPCEVDANGDPTEEYWQRRRKGYADPEPHRHKFDAKTMKKMRETLKKATPGSLGPSENRNQPCYSIHFTLKGEERRFTYVQSRYFYCCAYESLAKKTAAFEKLIDFSENSYALTICGYDAYPVTKTLYEHYCDPTKPFGHELVLYTLLTYDLGDGQHSKYPWHEYRENHPDIYEGIAHVLTGEEEGEEGEKPKEEAKKEEEGGEKKGITQ